MKHSISETFCTVFNDRMGTMMEKEDRRRSEGHHQGLGLTVAA